MCGRVQPLCQVVKLAFLRVAKCIFFQGKHKVFCSNYDASNEGKKFDENNVGAQNLQLKTQEQQKRFWIPGLLNAEVQAALNAKEHH